MVIVVKDISNYVQGRQASVDAIARCLYAFYILGMSRNQLSKIYHVGRTTIYRWIQRYENTKTIGRICAGKLYRRYNLEKRNLLVDYFRKYPLAYLDEAKLWFQNTFFFNISLSSVWRIIHEAGLTRKVVERRAIQICIADIDRYIINSYSKVSNFNNFILDFL